MISLSVNVYLMFVFLLYCLYLLLNILTTSQYGLKTFLIKIKSSELLHIYFIAINSYCMTAIDTFVSIFIWSEVKRY